MFRCATFCSIHYNNKSISGKCPCKIDINFIPILPVYTLPGTWNDPEKIALCNDTLIPHFTFNPDYTFMISIAVITILLAGYGVYKGFFANKGLSDPWDDHDD